jgi:hypothetical protein
MDSRAQSIGISRFFLALVVGAIMYWIVSLIADPVLSGATNTTTNATANQGTSWLQSGVDFLPVAFLGIGFFGLIAFAVYRREVTR